MPTVQFKKIKGFSFSSHIDITKRAFFGGIFFLEMLISAIVVIILQLLVNTFYYFTFPGALSACMNICLSPTFLQQQKKKLHTKRFFLQSLSKKKEECFISQFYILGALYSLIC